MSSSDTIVAAATPAGRSALAIVRVDGPLAATLAHDALRRRTPLAEKTATLGIWRDGDGAPIDQVVAVLWRAGRSFTGNDSLEITCHGNPLLVRRLTADCLARGARLAEPGEFTRRAYLAGRIDLTQAEAVADLIHASSERALASARRQLAGELGRLVARWTDRTLQVLAELEAHIDFPEEDLPPEDPRGPSARLLENASELSNYARTARHDACSTRSPAPTARS